MSIKISTCSYNNTIIGGINNTAIGNGSIAIGSQGSIGTCGSIGIGGSIGTCGSQGTAGPQGYMTNWQDELESKYNNRFTIKTEYDAMTFAPIITVIDNNTNEEYKLKQQFTHTQPEETDLFIQQLITDIRETKINNIINASKD